MVLLFSVTQLARLQGHEKTSLSIRMKARTVKMLKERLKNEDLAQSQGDETIAAMVAMASIEVSTSGKCHIRTLKLADLQSRILLEIERRHLYTCEVYYRLFVAEVARLLWARTLDPQPMSTGKSHRSFKQRITN